MSGAGCQETMWTGTVQSEGDGSVRQYLWLFHGRRDGGGVTTDQKKIKLHNMDEERLTSPSTSFTIWPIIDLDETPLIWSFKELFHYHYIRKRIQVAVAILTPQEE